MKSILLITFLTIVSIKVYPQSGLSFSQVLIVNDSAQVVPPGKVWKIESYQQQQFIITRNSTNSCSDLSKLRPYHIGGYSYYSVQGIGYGAGNETYMLTSNNSFPIWIKAGISVHTTCPGDFLSIIEFSIN